MCACVLVSKGSTLIKYVDDALVALKTKRKGYGFAMLKGISFRTEAETRDYVQVMHTLKD